MEQNLNVFDFTLTDDEMARIATMDTGASLFFDHRDPAVVKRLGEASSSLGADDEGLGLMINGD